VRIGAIALSLLPLLSISPKGVAYLTGNYNYAIDPFFKGAEGKVRVEARSSYFGECYGFLYIRKGNSLSTYELIDQVHFLGKPRSGYFSKTFVVPASKVASYSTSIPLYFGVNKIPPSQMVDPGLVGGPSFYVSQDVRINKGTSSFVPVLEERQEVLTGYKYIVNCSTWSSHREVPVSYLFSELSPKGEANRRCIPIGKTTVSLYDPYGVYYNSVGGNAELRIVDYLDDFDMPRGGLPYLSFPLALTAPVIDGDFASYHFAPTRLLYYSRKDLSMHETPPAEPYFSSKDIFIPLRKKHDFTTYFYQIVLTDFGPFRREKFVIQGRISFSSRLFGSGKEGEFYVTLGGD